MDTHPAHQFGSHGPGRTPGRGGSFLALLGALLGAPGMTCPPAAPPPTLPLPTTADPPRDQEIRVHVVAGAGASDRHGSVVSGGALRADYAPLPGLLVGFELGGGARENSAQQEAASEDTARETALSGRLQAGYGLWLYRQTLSFAAEVGLTTGLHSEKGGFVGPDLTLSLSAGGAQWWDATVSYRLAYMLPSRSRQWSRVLYHLAALSFTVPRRGRYAGFAQVGLSYGHLMVHRDESLAVMGLLGFRFTYVP